MKWLLSFCVKSDSALRVPLRLLQVFLYLGIGAKRQGLFPAADGIAIPVGSILGIAQDGQGVGRIGSNPHRAFRVGQGLNRIPGSEQQRDVVVQEGRILALPAKRGLEEGSSLAKIPVLHLVFSGDEISRSGYPRIALLLQCRERLAIHLAVADQLVADFRLAFQVVGRGERRHFVGTLADRRGGALRANASRFDTENNRFRNRVRVLTDVILEMSAVFSNLVGIDGAAIFQVNDFGGGADRAQKQTR